MDSKKVIEKLVKIAENQQKIINKLAQTLTESTQPAPQSFDPQHPELRVADVVMQHLPQGVKESVKQMDAKGDTLNVYFQPGKASQQAVGAITGVVQNLYNKRQIPFAYKVNPAG